MRSLRLSMELDTAQNDFSGENRLVVVRFSHEQHQYSFKLHHHFVECSLPHILTHWHTTRAILYNASYFNGDSYVKSMMVEMLF
jgi:hypothetical protein